MANELIPFTTPTTTLEAVNECLKAIGEAPVSDLTDGGASADVESAFGTLQNVSRAVQVEGWNFNTEEASRIVPDNNGFLTLPANTLRVDSVEPDRDIRVSMRGNRLYDKTNKTFVFTSAVTCDLVLLLPFEELPEYARRYITIRAVREFSDNELASDTVHSFKLAEEEQARVMMESLDVEDDDTSLKSSPFFREHLTMGRHRRNFGR